MDFFFQSVTLLLVLLNPFLLSIYLIDFIQKLSFTQFAQVLMQGTSISCCVFVLFAWLGDAIFQDILQVRFASFLIFGGIVFLIIGIRFVFRGSEALRSLRGNPQEEAGVIAMPYMIGPGTVSASILAGSRLTKWMASLSILTALTLTVIGIFVFKGLHDYVKKRDEKLVERYIDVVGRVMALVIGTLSIEMIVQGIEILFTEWGLVHNVILPMTHDP